VEGSGGSGFLDSVLRGMALRPALPVDHVIADGVRNFLFGTRENGA